MTTGVVIDKQTADGEERYLVRTALYAVPALEAWAKSAIDEALASVLVAKYNTQRSQYAPNLVRAQSKLNEYQQIIGRESARPVRPFDPMDEHYNDTTQWQNVALLRHAEKKLPEAEQAVAQAAQAVGAFSYMSNVEKLKKRQAQLDKNKRYADMSRFIERWLSPRDCADFDVGDAVLVVALDFVGERYVLHPKKIERDYIQEINSAYVSYAQATIANRHAKYHVDAIDELIDAENKKPPLPLGPYQDLGLAESLVVQIEMCDYQLAGLLPVLEKYQTELQAAVDAQEPTEALQYLVSQLAEYRDELVDKRSDYTLALSEQIARPEPQRGQYRDANYLNGLNQQRADHEQTIAQSQAEIDQAQAELDEAKAYAIARAGEDTQAKGYRQINKISTVSRAIGTDPKAWFVNEALKYGANKWKPFFITGEVTAAQGSTITLAPDAVKPAASGQANFAPLGLDQPTQIQLANNNYSYEVGDHAIIKINNPETREFEPFGWVKGARCGFKFGQATNLPGDFPYKDLFELRDIASDNLNAAFKRDGQYPYTGAGLLDGGHAAYITWLGYTRRFDLATPIRPEARLRAISPFSFDYELPYTYFGMATGGWFRGFRSFIPGAPFAIDTRYSNRFNFGYPQFMRGIAIHYCEIMEDYGDTNLVDIRSGNKVKIEGDFAFRSFLHGRGTITLFQNRLAIDGVEVFPERTFTRVYKLREDVLCGEDQGLFRVIWFYDGGFKEFEIYIPKDLELFMKKHYSYSETPYIDLFNTAENLKKESNGCGTAFTSPLIDAHHLNAPGVMDAGCLPQGELFRP